MNPKDREQIEDDIETPENTDEPETVDETDEDEDAEEDEEESEEEEDEESEEEDDDGDDEDDDEDEENEDDDEDEDLKGVGERAKKRIGKLTGEVKDLKRELEEARKLTGDDGRAILAAAETAGILPQLMSADEAKGIKELDSKTSAKKYLKKLLRSDDDEFEIGGETRSRRWVQGELDDLEEEIGELRERYGAKRRELAEKSKRIFELGMAAQKAGWKPGEKGAEKKGAARKPHKGQKATKAAKPARKGLSFINRKKGGKKDLDWGSVTDDASAEAMLLAEMEDYKMAGLYTVQKNLQKPDYMDGMIRLTKYKTPLLTMLKRGKKPVNWAQEVELEGAITPGDLAAQEGADFDESGFDAEGTLVMKHQLQMFKSKKGFKVTEESEELPSHNESGTNAALARQIRIDAERTLQSIENTLGSEQEAVERGTGNDTVPRTRGIACWLKPLPATRGSDPEVSNLDTTGATNLHSVQTIPWQACPRYGFDGNVKSAEAFNQDVMAEIIRKSALQAGDDDISLVFLCGLSLKALISAWSYKVTSVQGVETTIRNNRNLKDRSIAFMCDTYEFDGGVFRAVTDNHLFADIVNSATKMQCVGDVPQWSGVAIKPENWSIDTLVPLKKHMLENRGGGPRGFHKATLRLGCKNPTGQFRVKYVAA